MTKKTANKITIDLKIILSIYTIGFSIGTITHLQGIIQKGIFKNNGPLFFNIFWDSLTLIDPFTALFVWINPQKSVLLASFIMLLDCIINAYSYSTGVFGEVIPGMIPWWHLLQAIFATYVFTTTPVVLEKLKN